MGPVQVLVVGFEAAVFSGAVLAELRRLGAAEVVRLVDVLLVERTSSGSLETLPAPPGLPEQSGVVVAALLGQPSGGQHDEPTTRSRASGVSTWSLADAVPVGSTAAVALIEHLWAAPLRDAIDRAGGTPLDETWLAPEDVRRLEGLLTSSPGAPPG